MRRPDPSEQSERWLAIVPTLGRSAHLAESVAALRREGGRVVVVAPQGTALPENWAADEGIQRVETDGALGFAAANLAAFAAAPWTELVALVNDDAIVENGWAAALLAGLDAHPRCAAVQGVVQAMTGDAIDGAGLAWNGWWQAVQIGHGEPIDAIPLQPAEIFGVSAAAAIYRRSALDQVQPLFAAALGSYYEDVDLAVRLRAAGWSARLVPAARARHAGSTTGRHTGAGRLVRRNRYAVLARALGLSLLPRLPKIVLRDVIDTVQAVFDGRPSRAARAATIVAGTLAGLLRLPLTLRRRGLLSVDELRRWTPTGDSR